MLQWQEVANGTDEGHFAGKATKGEAPFLILASQRQIRETNTPVRFLTRALYLSPLLR